MGGQFTRARRALGEFATAEVLVNTASFLTENSSLRTATLTCARQCAPSSVHRICCFFAMRWLTTRVQVGFHPAQNSIGAVAQNSFGADTYADLRDTLSLRDLVEMMMERGLSQARTTLLRAVKCYAPEFIARWNRFGMAAVQSWRVDEIHRRFAGGFTCIGRLSASVRRLTSGSARSAT